MRERMSKTAALAIARERVGSIYGCAQSGYSYTVPWDLGTLPGRGPVTEVRRGSYWAARLARSESIAEVYSVLRGIDRDEAQHRIESDGVTTLAGMLRVAER